jgi:hypothetical protein
MGVSVHHDLLQMVAPFIEREDTVMKNSIPASQRHFLAAGKHLKI